MVGPRGLRLCTLKSIQASELDLVGRRSKPNTGKRSASADAYALVTPTATRRSIALTARGMPLLWSALLLIAETVFGGAPRVRVAGPKELSQGLSSEEYRILNARAIERDIGVARF
jgi:hypothetical protein